MNEPWRRGTGKKGGKTGKNWGKKNIERGATIRVTWTTAANNAGSGGGKRVIGTKVTTVTNAV